MSEFARQTRTQWCARTFLDGSGCLWEVVNKGRRSPLDPDGAVIIGLSKEPNLNTGLHESQEERVLVTQKGLNGITRRGKHLVKSGGKYLEEGGRPKTVVFATCTLPGDAKATLEAAAEWPAIVNRFRIAMGRELAKHGLPPHFLGVTEIQEKRFLREGGMPLHLHFVFLGRQHQYQPWAISCDRMRLLWARAVSGGEVSKQLNPESWRSSVDMQMVKHSVAGYLGKYMSKGVGAIQTVTKEHPELVAFLPKHWYFCTEGLRRAVDRKTAYGEIHAEAIAAMSRSPRPELFFRWMKEVEILNGAGTQIAVVLCYDLTPKAMEMLGIQVSEGEAFSTGLEVVE